MDHIKPNKKKKETNKLANQTDKPIGHLNAVESIQFSCQKKKMVRCACVFCSCWANLLNKLGERHKSRVRKGESNERKEKKGKKRKKTSERARAFIYFNSVLSFRID